MKRAGTFRKNHTSKFTWRNSPRRSSTFHRGRTIPDLTFTSFYVGADAWQHSDIQNIDRALAAAMGDPSLNNVMAQYFSRPPTSAFKPSEKLPGPAPARMSQGDVERLVSDLLGRGKFDCSDLGSTVVNVMLPPGAVFNYNPQ